MKQNASIVTFILALLIINTGCETSPGADDSILPFTTRKPIDAAGDLFNVYDPDIRRRAINELSGAPFGGEDSYVKSYRLLSEDPDPTVRASAIRALSNHGSIEDVKTVFIPNLQYPDRIVRWEAARALQRFHHPDVIEPLVRLVRDGEDTDVRVAGIFALGQYPDPNVFQALVGLLNSDDYAVVSQSVKTLRLLTGQQFGDDAREWLAWSANKQDYFKARGDYYYKDYSRPRTFTEKLAFWQKEKTVEPQKPLREGETRPEPESDESTKSSGND